MPIWLITFLTGLIEPIVNNILTKLMIDARLKSVENKSDAINAAFNQYAKAQTDQERDDALIALTKSANS